MSLRQLLERLGTDDFLTTIEEMTMYERYYTPEQLRELERRRQALGDEAIREVEREWAEIFATLRAEMDAGTDPADPKLRPLAERGQELVAMFTGGDAGITSALGRCGSTRTPSRSPTAWSTPSCGRTTARCRRRASFPPVPGRSDNGRARAALDWTPVRATWRTGSRDP